MSQPSEDLPLVDTAVRMETPEGVEIELRPAGLFARGMALMIDLIIRFLIGGLVLFVAAYAGATGVAVFFLIFFVVYWLYGVLFEVLAGGQTPGKKSQNLMVVHDDGSPIRLPASLIRNLLLVIDIWPGFYVVGTICLLITGDRRVGDLVAGTLVVYVDPAPIELARTDVAPKPLPIPLNSEEQLELVEFLEREASFSVERRQELATILAPALNIAPSDVLSELRAYAQGIRGAHDVTHAAADSGQ